MFPTVHVEMQFLAVGLAGANWTNVEDTAEVGHDVETSVLDRPMKTKLCVCGSTCVHACVPVRLNAVVSHESEKQLACQSFFFSLSLLPVKHRFQPHPVRVKGERLPATATAVVSVAAGFADSQTTTYC